MCAVTVLLSEYIRQGCILYICQLTEHNLSFLFSLYKAVILSPFSLSLMGTPVLFFLWLLVHYFRMKIGCSTKKKKKCFIFICILSQGIWHLYCKLHFYCICVCFCLGCDTMNISIHLDPIRQEEEYTVDKCTAVLTQRDRQPVTLASTPTPNFSNYQLT